MQGPAGASVRRPTAVVAGAQEQCSGPPLPAAACRPPAGWVGRPHPGLTLLPAAMLLLQNHSEVDLEALEKDNDREIAALGDRVGLLKNVTGGIQTEVHSQHNILDNMVGPPDFPFCVSCIIEAGH